MKGIVLAGGHGTRLRPITLLGSKQLLPVYDKPMVYYPISTLMSAGIREMLIITAPQELHRFEQLLGTGSQLGCRFTYAVQENPNGLAEAFLIGEDFIGDSSVALILGDNIFYGTGLAGLLQQNTDPQGAVIYAYHVQDPQRYGVVAFNAEGKAVSLEEKPQRPKSSYAVPGIYFYDSTVVAMAKQIRPRAKGELEITDLNRLYLEQDRLQVSIMDRGTAWLDTGTFASLMNASQFVEVIEERQGLKIGAIEETAFRMGFIDAAQLLQLARPLMKSGYGEYLEQLVR